MNTKVSKAMLALFIGLAFLVGICSIHSQAWAGGYTDKSYHDSGDIHTYKHPKKGSYTSPFDYGAKTAPYVAPEPKGTCNCFTFDATKSYDVDGQKLTVAWDFGDGTTSDKPVVQHCYDKAGAYKVNLTVKDSSGMVCDTGVATTSVDANFPPTAVAQNVSACVGEGATFDGSASTASGPALYTWDFGDGTTGEGAKVTHAYQKAGTYRVMLKVDDGKKTTCSVAQASATATIADSVSVSVTGPEAICTGNTASFDAMGTGGSLKYLWDFGDGTTLEDGSKVSHAYQKGGDYTVSVTADNGQGFGCSKASASTRIKVSTPPIADAGQNLACCVGEATTFDGSKSNAPDGSRLSYRWDFGDGQTAEGAKVTHSYEKSGNYKVVLTVKTDSGASCDTAMSSFMAKVNTKPEAVIEVK